MLLVAVAVVFCCACTARAGVVPLRFRADGTFKVRAHVAHDVGAPSD